jgi:hypothetical protein
MKKNPHSKMFRVGSSVLLLPDNTGRRVRARPLRFNAFGSGKCGWLHALTPHVCAETPLVCVRAHLWGGRSAHSTMFRVGITVLHEGHPDRKYVVIARNGEHVTCREVGTRKECVCGSSLLTPVDTWVWTPDSQAFFKRVDKGTPKYCQGCRI